MPRPNRQRPASYSKSSRPGTRPAGKNGGQSAGKSAGKSAKSPGKNAGKPSQGLGQGAPRSAPRGPAKAPSRSAPHSTTQAPGKGSQGPSQSRPSAAPGWQTGKGGKRRVPAGTNLGSASTAKDVPWDRGAAWAAAKTSKQRRKGPQAGVRGGAPGANANPYRGPMQPLPPGQPRSQQAPRQVWGHTAPPSRSRLEVLLTGYGVALPGTVLDKVWAYHQILRKNNHDQDLTRLIGFETIVQRHYADCLILHKMMKSFFGGWPSPMVDIGTGAGFPGLMIKIASPETKLILSEPRNVRVDYLNNTIKELGLKDIEVFGHKFTSKSFDRPLKGAISRAFEPIQKTLPRLEKSLQIGGLAMFMKGPGVDEELSAPIPANYKLVRDERYRIPNTTLDRALVVFERIA